jgi:hypothetical protein
MSGRSSRLNGVLKVAILALLFTTLSGCGVAPSSGRVSGDEQARVTSPDGLFDAVLLREDGWGAGGGWEWYVYIAAKGKPAEEGSEHLIFDAGTLTGGKLVWRQPHLLEIQYNIAYINQFKNLAVRKQNVGGVEQDYLVEIRLAPVSQDFSLLAPDGTFKPKQ